MHRNDCFRLCKQCYATDAVEALVPLLASEGKEAAKKFVANVAKSGMLPSLQSDIWSATGVGLFVTLGIIGDAHHICKPLIGAIQLLQSGTSPTASLVLVTVDRCISECAVPTVYTADAQAELRADLHKRWMDQLPVALLRFYAISGR